MPHYKASHKWLVWIVLVVLIFGINASNLPIGHIGAVQRGLAFVPSHTETTYYLPVIRAGNPWYNPFGTEVTIPLSSGSEIRNRAVELSPGWIRLNARISWRKLQPKEADPIQWEILEGFEAELRALNEVNMTPVVVVNDFPYWAEKIVRADGQYTSCGPIREDKFPAFASFLGQLVARYKTLEFNVHHWELGNEPDVDPDLVPINHQFGCWGDIDDPYYGGEYYGEMLKAVAPAIRAEDPDARIWMGGLLLGAPFTTDPALGQPEMFFRGVLESGAASSFDILPYHWYSSYYRIKIDYDLNQGWLWGIWGGGTVGKARFLRQIMQAYGVDKPVSMNESGLGCPYDRAGFEWCKPPNVPDPEFFQIQADCLVRSYIRGINAQISSFFWYTLNGPGLRHMGLLDLDYTPRPAYVAYQQLISRLKNGHILGPVDYSAGIEAYAFQNRLERVHVIWTIEDITQNIAVPVDRFKAAYTRDGVPVDPPISGGNYIIPVGFSPIYVYLTPR